MSPEAQPPPPPPHSSFNPGGAVSMGGPKTSAAALWSLILGAVSMVCCCVSGLPGLILGIIGLVNIGKSQGRLKGKGLAITGIILSCIFPIVNSGVFWSLRTTNDPQLKKVFEGFGDIFGVGEQMTKATRQATAIAGALKAYADGHNGVLPANLEALVSEGLLDAGELEAPSGSPGPGFWELTVPGKVLADLDPNDTMVKGGPFVLMGEELYIIIRASGEVKPVEAARLK